MARLRRWTRTKRKAQGEVCEGLPPEIGGRKRRESPMIAKHLMSELRLRPPDYFGCAVALPMSRTTFQLPSFCSFQMLVYFPYSTVGLPSLSLEWNS
jgi:hypothetical protein